MKIKLMKCLAVTLIVGLMAVTGAIAEDSIKMITKTSNPFLKQSGIDSTIHEVYMDCFKAIERDSDIHIAMYMWHNSDKPKVPCNPKALTDKFIEKVKDIDPPGSANVIFDIDGYDKKLAAETFKNQLTKARANVYYPQFKKIIIDEGGVPKMHNKTMLFSRLSFTNDSPPKQLSALAGKTIDYVVVQSSANIWQTQYSQANQVVVYYGNKAFYDYTLELWDGIKADVKKDELKNNRFTPNETTSKLVGNVKTYALPRSGNIIKSVLENMEEFKGDVKPKIRIAMGDFTQKDVAEGLVAIKENGGLVQIVARKGTMGQAVTKILNKGDVDYILLSEDKESGGFRQKVHSKFLLFDGRYSLNGQLDKYKISWAGCLNYTNPGLSDNSETLVRMNDRAHYDELLTAWYKLRYTESLPSIQASIGYAHNDKIYFFSDSHYVLWKPDEGIKTVNTNHSLRELGEYGWKSFPYEFRNCIDAALLYSNNDAYFFKGSKYIKYKPGEGLEGSIRTIGKTGWKSFPSYFKCNIDAALLHPTNGHAYFFKGKKYIKYKPGEGLVGSTRTIGKDGWHGLPFDRVDAALTHPTNDNIYFFKGNKYCKWVPGDGVEQPKVRKTGVYGWQGLLF